MHDGQGGNLEQRSKSLTMQQGVALLFEIQPSSGAPIYRQVIDQVHRLVASGTLNPGDELPSIREMASTFEVNQMTISKAYSLLEAQGVLKRVRGKRMEISDSFVSRHGPEQRMELIRPALRQVVSQAHQLSLSDEEIIRELQTMLESKDE
jgi:GntR family transcriptional regulator